MKHTLKHFIAKALPYTIIFISIYSILPYYSMKLPLLVYFSSTTAWWSISYIILIFFFISVKHFFEQKNIDNFRFVKYYLMWVFICILRGMYVADGYWDWKALANNTMALLLPIVAYIASNKVAVQSLLSFYIKYGLPLFVFLMLLIRTDAYGFFLMPVSFMLLFLPALSQRQKIILLLCSLN